MRKFLGALSFTCGMVIASLLIPQEAVSQAITRIYGTRSGAPIALVADASGNLQISLGTLTSAQLATILSDETGTGVVVFGTSPTFTTQVILPNGSETTPALVPTGATTVGLLWSGLATTSVFDVALGGVDRVRIGDGGGNLGGYGFTVASNGQFAFNSGAISVGTATIADVAISRNAAGVLEINNGSAGTLRDGLARDVRLTGPRVTAGTGTGITVNDAGAVRSQVYQVTVARTAFVCNATTCDVTIGTLPARTFLRHALADLTTTFACTDTCTTATLSFTLGKTAGATQYLLSWDADAAAGQFGDAAAELGASLAPATVATMNGDLGSWTGTQAVHLQLTSGAGAVGDGTATHLSQGSVTMYLDTVVYP